MLSRTSATMLRAIVAYTILSGLLSGCHMLTRTTTDSWPQVRGYCRELDEMCTRHRATRRAIVSLRRCHPYQNCDFRSGYVQAYVDVSVGGSGDVPPVPPERYWKACSRDPEGRHEASDWFAGYAAGSERALASRWHRYNTIPASGAMAGCSNAACYSENQGW